jgi:hypothetical protein
VLSAGQKSRLGEVRVERERRMKERNSERKIENRVEGRKG